VNIIAVVVRERGTRGFGLRLSDDSMRVCVAEMPPTGKTYYRHKSRCDGSTATHPQTLMQLPTIAPPRLCPLHKLIQRTLDLRLAFSLVRSLLCKPHCKFDIIAVFVTHFLLA
jgi:hypothetical protein